jgi:molybdenum cofactor cytidylyltransferase
VNPRRIVPIILAAGASRRLGFPKPLARFGDKTALEIAVENCAGLCGPIVVLGWHASRVRRAVPGNARIVVNRGWRSGQLGSFLAGLRRVSRRDAFMLYPVDYPLLTRGVVGRLVRAFRSTRKQLAVPSHRRRGGHPVIFAPGLREELRAARTARDVVYRDPARIRFVPVRTDAIWRDIDTRAAYRNRLREFNLRGGRTAPRRGSTPAPPSAAPRRTRSTAGRRGR